jgi:glutamate dehydrogenase/leucine dehydrogenase
VTPYFVANCGGAIAAVGMETGGWSPAEARKRVRQMIRINLFEILELVTNEGITPDAAAQRIADRRLSGTGNWYPSLFSIRRGDVS